MIHLFIPKCDHLQLPSLKYVRVYILDCGLCNNVNTEIRSLIHRTKYSVYCERQLSSDESVHQNLYPIYCPTEIYIHLTWIYKFDICIILKKILTKFNKFVLLKKVLMVLFN